MDQNTPIPVYEATPDNNVTKVKKRSRKPLMLFSLLIIVVTTLIISAIFLGSSKKKEPTTNSQNSVSNTVKTTNPVSSPTTKASTNDDTQSAEDIILNITTPKANAIVGGEIILDGTVSRSISKLSVEILDIDDVILGKGLIEVSPTGVQEIVPWNAKIYLDTAPENQLGRIIVKVENNQEISTSQPVIFKKYTNPERVELISPIENQLVVNKNILIKGKFTGFFEATVNYRVKDEFNNTLIESTFMLEADNYGNWVDFEKEMMLENLSQNSGKSGTLQIYELSMENGEERMLLEIPISFVE